MLKKLYDLANILFGVVQDTQTNKAQIKQLQQEQKAISETLRELAFEIRRVREDDAHEREKMALRLENALLRFERGLLAGERGRLPDSDVTSPVVKIRGSSPGSRTAMACPWRCRRAGAVRLIFDDRLLHR